MQYKLYFILISILNKRDHLAKFKQNISVLMIIYFIVTRLELHHNKIQCIKSKTPSVTTKIEDRN